MANYLEEPEAWAQRSKHGMEDRATDARSSLPLPVALKMLPTPAARDWKGAGHDHQLPTELMRTPTTAPWNQGGSGGEQAKQLKKLLPTPVESDADGARNETGKENPKAGRTLMDAMLLPTPQAAEGDRESEAFGRGNPTLRGSLLPTPQAGDGQRGADFAREERRGRRRLKAGEMIHSGGDDLLTATVREDSISVSTSPPSSGGRPSSAGLVLNPSFVEWMMGLPAGWSDPDCPLSATEFSSRPGGCSAA